MILKKILISLSVSSFLILNACGVKESNSELKVEPVTVLTAIQTAIAAAQVIYERGNAISQTDINRIIDAIDAAKQEVIAHADHTLVNDWIAEVDALQKSFLRYRGIRESGDQLGEFLFRVESAHSHLESIFNNVQVYQSYRAAPAYNALSAMYLVALMDYHKDIKMVKALTASVIAVNEKFTSVPPFPAHTMVDGKYMQFENCKVITATFTMDQRAYILYSVMSPWAMGYHKRHEFRYYRAGQHMGSCFEDKNGNGAGTSVFGMNIWSDKVPVWYNENVKATQGDKIYATVKSSNDSLKEYLGFFIKNGNNGTVSCKTFCEDPQWGATGSCVGSFLGVNQLRCDAIPGFITDGSQLTCQCAAP